MRNTFKVSLTALAVGALAMTGQLAHATLIHQYTTLIGGTINDGNFDGSSSSSTSNTALKIYNSTNNYPTYSTLYADGATTENTNGNIAALGSPEWTGTTSGGHLGFVNYSGPAESSPNVYLANNGTGMSGRTSKHYHSRSRQYRH